MLYRDTNDEYTGTEYERLIRSNTAHAVVTLGALIPKPTAKEEHVVLRERAFTVSVRRPLASEVFCIYRYICERGQNVFYNGLTRM